MTDKRISDLTEDTSPARTDLLYKVDNGGTTDRRVQLANLLKQTVPGDITGLGSAALAATTAFDAAGAAAAAQAASQPADSDLTAIAALSTTSYGRAFLALADAAAGRTALGLGTSSTHATGDFLQTANNLSDVTAATARTNLALGTAATADKVAAGATGVLDATDPTTTNTRTPTNASVTLATLASALVDTILPWRIERNFGASAVAAATTGTWSTTAVASTWGGLVGFNSTNAQNDAIADDFILAAGTWSLTVVYDKASTWAIDTLDLDGASLTSLSGSATTIDLYNASTVVNQSTTITGIVVATTGKKRLTHKAATRNASSGGWTLGLVQVIWRRTA